MKNWGALFAAAILMACATHSMAQTAQPSARAIALAERVINVTTPNLEQEVLAHMRNEVAEMVMSGLDADKGLWLSKNAGPLLIPHLNRYMDEFKLMYARELSEAELQAILDFYESPMGRDIAKKQGKIGLAVSTLIEPMYQGYMSDLLTGMCSAFDCDDELTNQSTAKSSRR